MTAFLLTALISALLVARKAPQHAHVVGALATCLAADLARLFVPMGPREAMVVCLVNPAVSAILYAKTFTPRDGPEEYYIVGAMWSLFALNVYLYVPGGWWEGPLVLAYAAAVASGLRDLVRFMGAQRGWTVSTRVAAMFLAGDTAGLLFLIARTSVHYQAGAVLGLVTAYQLWWLRRWNRGLR